MLFRSDAKPNFKSKPAVKVRCPSQESLKRTDKKSLNIRLTDIGYFNEEKEFGGSHHVPCSVKRPKMFPVRSAACINSSSNSNKKDKQIEGEISKTNALSRVKAIPDKTKTKIKTTRVATSDSKKITLNKLNQSKGRIQSKDYKDHKLKNQRKLNKNDQLNGRILPNNILTPHTEFTAINFPLATSKPNMNLGHAEYFSPDKEFHRRAESALVIRAKNSK